MTLFPSTHISIFDKSGTVVLASNPNVDANDLAIAVLNAIAKLPKE